MTTLPRILKQGSAKFRDNEVDIAVLDNKTRIIIGDGTCDDAFLGKLPSFIETYKSHASKLAEYIVLDESKITPKVAFEAQDGTEAVGYDCVVLAEIADAYYKYKASLRLADTTPTDDMAAAIEFAAELLVNLAYIGVTAMVDEVTGYQKVRAKTELQDTLQARLANPLLEPLSESIN